MLLVFIVIITIIVIANVGGVATAVNITGVAVAAAVICIIAVGRVVIFAIRVIADKGRTGKNPSVASVLINYPIIFGHHLAFVYH